MSSKSADNPVVVIGGGIGGLTAAIRLACRGLQVVLFEQNRHVGGKMNEWRQEGFRFDTGPSVLTMRHTLEELFATANRRLENYVQLLPIDPMMRCLYSDGSRLDLTGDWPNLSRQLAYHEPRDVEGYLRYLSHAARLFRITGPVFVYNQPPSWRSLFAVPPHHTFQFDPLRTMDQAVRSFVRSPKLRQALNRFATYVGASPYRAPATLNVIGHVELTGGVWYPVGGVYALARALEQLALELGVDIHRETPVDQILVERQRVVGIRLVNGLTIPTAQVVTNVDVTTTYERLLNQQPFSTKRIQQLRRRELSSSGFIMMLGVAGQHPELLHHNLIFSADYPAEFRQIFKEQLPPSDPSIYISITSKTDPNHAPPDCENWFILVNVPAFSDRFDWQRQASSYRQLVLDRLAARGWDIRSKIRVERLLTPVDLERQSGAWRGALYGASSNSRWAAFLRPHNRCREVRGLYFAGGTTHPGGGVPMVVLSGKVAADYLWRDYQKLNPQKAQLLKTQATLPTATTSTTSSRRGFTTSDQSEAAAPDIAVANPSNFFLDSNFELPASHTATPEAKSAKPAEPKSR